MDKADAKAVKEAVKAVVTYPAISQEMKQEIQARANLHALYALVERIRKEREDGA